MNKLNNQFLSEQNQTTKLDHIRINSLNFNFKSNSQIIFCKLKLPKIELKTDITDYDPYIVGISPSTR
jgi:hypothetical protein